MNAPPEALPNGTASSPFFYSDTLSVLVFAYKALLLLFGVFLALETRGRKPRYVNDLRLVLLAICNVSVLCLICAPVVVFLLRTQTDAFYAFASATGNLSDIIYNN